MALPSWNGNGMSPPRQSVSNVKPSRKRLLEILEQIKDAPVKCQTCEGTGFVCENHRDRPWGGLSEHRADACLCGCGWPCPNCNHGDP